MSLYSRFGAVYADLLAEFPGAAAGDFAGPSGSDGQARLEAALDAAEQAVVAALPPALRRMLDRVEGVELVSSAAEGLAAATLPLAVAATPDLAVWRNWPRAFWPALPERSAALPAGTAWKRTGQTVTLQAGWELSAGDNLVASWSHAAAAADPYLAGLLLGLARGLLASRVFQPGESGFEAAEARQRGCLEELARLRAGQAAIPAFARLVLVTARPGCALGRAREVLEAAAETIQSYITEAGGCDHQTGICMCDEIALVEKIRAIVLASPAPPEPAYCICGASDWYNYFASGPHTGIAHVLCRKCGKRPYMEYLDGPADVGHKPAPEVRP